MSKTTKKNKSKMQQGVIVIPVVVFAVATWVLWWFYPNVSSIFLAFQNRTGEFTFANFVEVWNSLTTAGGVLAVSLKNTLLYFFVGTAVRIPLVTFVCYFLYKKIYGYKFFRIMFYMSAIIPSVAMAGVFKIFVSSTGPLGKICEQLGIFLPNEGLLGTVGTATPTIVVYEIWTCFAGGLLLINGAMARIPTEILESAKIDGCGMARELFQFILPLIWPTISTLIVLSCTGIISAGGGIVMLLQPDTQYGTSTLYYWMFRKVYGSGTGSGDYGVVSAMGLCFTLLVVPFTLLVRKLLDKVPTVEY